MEFVIISGMSGAGKTTALHVLEDIGYYCVDNIPSSLLTTLYDLCRSSNDESMNRVAVVVDVRGNENYKQMSEQIEDFKKTHKDVKLLFFDAKTDVLIVRFKETRRKHPLAERLKDGSVTDAVDLEKALLESVKRHADYHIDTTFMSFGFKYGLPLEADMVLDVRCLPNPFYIPELKPLTGNDQAVRDYVLSSPDTQGLLQYALKLLDFTVPLYRKEGKSELVVGIGCTGGKHRSVTMALQFEEHFRELGYRCAISHRDINK